jgi:hypothetical protein
VVVIPLIMVTIVAVEVGEGTGRWGAGEFRMVVVEVQILVGVEERVGGRGEGTVR